MFPLDVNEIVGWGRGASKMRLCKRYAVHERDFCISSIFFFFLYVFHFSIFYFYFISLSCVFAEVFYLIHRQDVLVFVWIGSNYCTEYFTYTRQPSRPRLFRLLFLLVIRHYIQ